jgi:hypothetical protein
MKFRTEVKMDSSPTKISHQQGIFASGSCFATHIGKRLQDLKLDVTLNPFGIVYNPVSLTRQYNLLLNKETFDGSRYLNDQDRTFHYDFHSELWGHSIKDWEERYRKIQQCALGKLQDSTVLIWTLGTSIAYRYSDGVFVANCHKQARDLFSKEMIEVEEMYSLLSRLIRSINKQKIILTVSPIRHTKEGLTHNTRSKARLIEVAHLLAANFDAVDYFPSYEIMMDDLRDYRFYEKDMIHPSQMALDYIWEKFSDAYFTSESKQLNKAIEKITAAYHHRPFHAEGNAFHTFCKKQIEQIHQLKTKHSYLDFQKELDHFKTYL